MAEEKKRIAEKAADQKLKPQPRVQLTKQLKKEEKMCDSPKEKRKN